MAFDTPGVSIEYKTDGPLVIRAASTSTAVFIGPTVVGRSVTGTNVEPTFVSALSEYGAAFSTPGARAGVVCLPTANNVLTDTMGLAIRGFFMNGGQNAYIVSTSAGNAAIATINLSVANGGGSAFYRVDANSEGAWGNDVNVAIADSAIAGDFVDITISIGFAGDDGTVASSETFTGVAADDLAAITSNFATISALDADPGGTQIAIGANGNLAGGANSGFSAATSASTNISLAPEGPGATEFFSATASFAGASGNSINISVADGPNPDTVNLTITGTLPGATDPTVETHDDIAIGAVDGIVSQLVTFAALGADPGGAPITIGNAGDLADGTDVAANETAAMGAIFEALRDFDDISLITFPSRVWPAQQADYSLALAHCQRMKDRVTLIQLADGTTDFANVSVPQDKFAAVYFPQARSTLPTPGGGSATMTANTTGHVAGIVARTDAEKGAWTAPAGLHASIAGITELTVDVGNSFQARMNPNNINALRLIQGIPVVWGARTRDQGGIYEYLPVMRTAILIGDSLREALQRAVFAKNTEVLWANITAGVNGFMDGLYAQGAFQGATPGQAFRVAVGLNQSMSQADIRAGICRVNVAFAPALVAEFIEISIEQIFEPG